MGDQAIESAQRPINKDFIVQDPNRQDPLQQDLSETPMTNFITPPEKGNLPAKEIEITDEARQAQAAENVGVNIAPVVHDQSEVKIEQDVLKKDLKSTTPKSLYCPICKEYQLSIVEFQTDKLARVLLILTYILLLPLICCFLIFGPPFKTKTIIHKCSECKNEIGRSGPFG